MHGLPVEVRVEVFRKVDARVGLGCDTVIGVLQFRFVDIDRDIGTPEVVKTSSMIEVQMAHNYAFDVLDVSPTLGNSFVELLILGVVHSCEDVVGWSTYLLGIVYPAASSVDTSVSVRREVQQFKHTRIEAGLPLDALSKH